MNRDRERRRNGLVHGVAEAGTTPCERERAANATNCAGTPEATPAESSLGYVPKATPCGNSAAGRVEHYLEERAMPEMNSDNQPDAQANPGEGGRPNPHKKKVEWVANHPLY